MCKCIVDFHCSISASSDFVFEVIIEMPLVFYLRVCVCGGGGGYFYVSLLFLNVYTFILGRRLPAPLIPLTHKPPEIRNPICL